MGLSSEIVYCAQQDSQRLLSLSKCYGDGGGKVRLACIIGSTSFLQHSTSFQRSFPDHRSGRRSFRSRFWTFILIAPSLRLRALAATTPRTGGAMPDLGFTGDAKIGFATAYLEYVSTSACNEGSRKKRTIHPQLGWIRSL